MNPPSLMKVFPRGKQQQFNSLFALNVEGAKTSR